jgi:glycosyltransferase involved in cell wall biosynthesis
MTVVEIIAAVRNEEESIPVFVHSVRSLTIPEGVDLRLTFVEDSSTDGTREVLRTIARQHPGVAYYLLERGFGQGPALIFGLSRSVADAAILMDVDGSHPPEVIPTMVSEFLDGADVVQCVRRTLARRRVYRKVGAALFQTLARWITRVDLAEQNIYYRLVSARVGRELVSQPRYWRLLRFPLPRQPGALELVYVDTQERAHGESKYGPWRLLGLAADAVLSLVPGPRLAVLAGSVAMVAAVCLWLGAWPLAIGLAMGIAWILHRYRALRSSDVLGRMRSQESANTSPRTAPPGSG